MSGYALWPMHRFAPALALSLVALAASVTLWRPVGALEPRSFVADQALVAFTWVATLLAIGGGLRRRPGPVALAAAFIGGGFIGAALVGGWRFTATPPAMWGALLLTSALWLLTFARVLGRSRLTGVGLALGALTGAAHLAARQPPPARTHPLAAALPTSASQPDRVVTFSCGSATLEVHALLAFSRTSRDGFWPGVSAADELEGEPPLEGPAQRAHLQRSPTWLTAFVALPHPVASHLNRYTDVRLLGARAPRLRFDDLGQTFDFLPFDYPRGRPAQFAFVRGRTLTVARGHDAEKGPFRHLASAPLSDEVLRLTFFDGARPLCGLEFDDFIVQADVSNESPTAGEGVTPNVIQFGVPAMGAPVPMVHLSLAETGIGAGLDTVVHAAGVYRNRLRVVPRD